MSSPEFLTQQFERLADRFRALADAGPLPPVNPDEPFYTYIARLPQFNELAGADAWPTNDPHAQQAERAMHLWDLARKASTLTALLPKDIGLSQARLPSTTACNAGNPNNGQVWFALVYEYLLDSYPLTGDIHRPAACCAGLCEEIIDRLSRRLVSCIAAANTPNPAPYLGLHIDGGVLTRYGVEIELKGNELRFVLTLFESRSTPLPRRQLFHAVFAPDVHENNFDTTKAVVNRKLAQLGLCCESPKRGYWRLAEKPK